MPKLEIIRELPSVEYLRKCFSYNARTGKLKWKKRPMEHFSRPAEFVRCNAMAGVEAGYFDNGYRRVSLNSIDHKVHRIVWKMMTGRDPVGMLDHKDGDGINNRWRNLREADQGRQTQNAKLRGDNLSGRRGVSWNQGKWRAVLAGRHLGYFGSIEDASEVYEVAACKLFGEFYRQPKYR